MSDQAYTSEHLTAGRGEQLARGHMLHARHCWCLDDSAECCVSSCPCHEADTSTTSEEADHG